MTRSVFGDASLWDTSDHLLAGIYDLLAGANWQRSGGKSARPKPITRPGARTTDEQRIGTAMPLPEMKELAKRWMAGELAEGR